MTNFQFSIPLQTPSHANTAAAAADQRLSFAFGPLVMPAFVSRPKAFQRRVLPSRFELFSKGQPVDFVYVVESGVVKLVNEAPDGTKSILGLRAGGCIIELSSAVLATPHQCAALTVTRSVVSCISSEDFRVSLSADARLFREVNQLMSREINSEEDQEIELRSSAVVTRLERLVSEFKESGTSVGPSVARMVSMKQTEIAQMLSITPSHLSRLIRKCSPGVEIATEQ